MGTEANFVGLTNKIGLTNTLSERNLFACRGLTVQACPVPCSVKERQAFIGLLGYPWSFIPYLAQILRPLYASVKKGTVEDWNISQQETFKKVKLVVKQVQGLGVLTPDANCELDVNMYPEGFGW